MKLFANKILLDPQENKYIGLYQLGNNRARMGIMTGLPAISLKNPDELKRFIDSKEVAYIVIRESEWKESFHNLPMIIQATDTGWIKSAITKAMTRSLLANKLSFQNNEYFESYILLKKTDTK